MHICLSGFELYSRWVPLSQAKDDETNNDRRKKHCDRFLLNWRGKGSDVRFPEFDTQ